ncbi:MAG: hypothetical protein EON54_28950 [Alcaligenaceae bacterium]|nr:MAG: hypothetical protein EON54_28950 [Alcaligenaceae bacterium]
MPSIFADLVDIVYSQERKGPGTPQRIKLPSPLFAQFQTDFRQLATEVGIEAIYPGSVLGVPVVESAGTLPLIITADGTESPLSLNPASA